MNKKTIICIALAVVLVVFLVLSAKVIDKGTEGQYTGEVAFDANASSGDDWSQISFNGSVGYIENDRVQIGMLSDKLEQYVAGISHYLTHEGAIEGVTMSTGNLALVQAISREEAMAERNPNAADADGDGDYVPMDDEGDYGVGSTWADLSNYDYSEHGYDSEDVDTSAAREAFDAADQENEFRAEDEFGG